MIETPRTKAGMRQRELLDFRTPQHPSLGTNNWDGASPLLARNIPKESLELRHLRLNTIRTRDEIFSAQPDSYASTHEYAAPTPSHSSRKGFLSKLKFRWKKKLAVLELNTKKRRLFPRGRGKWDSKNRWPQGWSLFFLCIQKVGSENCRWWRAIMSFDWRGWLQSLIFPRVSFFFGETESVSLITG